MRIAIGCDHRGFPYTGAVGDALAAAGHELLDCGTHSDAPADYPDFARAVGTAVRDGHADLGVLICGSGAGVSIAANKIRGVRAALCHDLFTARQAREDDDANVICLGARVVTREQAVELARTFVGARFSGAERHVRRLAKVLALEAETADSARPSPECWPTGPVLTGALEQLERQGVGARIWNKDATLWSDDARGQATIVQRLGWLDAPVSMGKAVSELRELAAGLRAEGFTDAVLLGMGGSSLAAEVLGATFPAGASGLALSVLDTTDPGAIRAARERVKLAHTVFVVASKSGTTTEMLALYRYFRAELEAQVASPGAHFIAITDRDTPLARLAAEGRFRRTFLNPPDIGGRFSALSLFGLVPAALLGVHLERLLERAAAMATACGPGSAAPVNPGLRLGAALGGFALAGRDKVTLVLSEPIRALGAWLEQLLTESTGKQGRGLVVVHEESLGPPEAYGPDRLFVGLTLGADPELARGLRPLQAAGHPVIMLPLAERTDLGGEFFRWEMATAAAGALLAVNPFDEPNVAQAKDATQAALATFKERGRLPEWPADSIDEAVRVIGQAQPGDYFALLAYVTPTPATTAALARLRRLLRDGTGLATTVGYGPRYLHSTGQLHKGGPPTPLIVMFASEDTDELPIPGERYGFATLKLAQALGDLATLRAAHRRALWLPVRHGSVVEAIERLTAALAPSLQRQL
ncbi:MAG: RpiB/LacA/LacB family sugar-phosphate isomerase [Candidatus Rokuibacteriota bacterium]